MYKVVKCPEEKEQLKMYPKEYKQGISEEQLRMWQVPSKCGRDEMLGRVGRRQAIRCVLWFGFDSFNGK